MSGHRHPRGNTMTGAEMIAVERHRQIETEGYTRQHDLAHGAPALLRAARCYEVPQVGDRLPDAWPWDEASWKPRDLVGNLVRAGALYQAAVDVSPPLGNDRSIALAGRDRCAKVLDWYAERIAEARRKGAAEALEKAAEALNTEGVGFSPGGWGSNDRDRDRLWGISKSRDWLRDRAAALRGDA